jgi:hypothetical protein
VEEEGEVDEQDMERARLREEEIAKKEDKSRAVVLEMLGDLPPAGTLLFAAVCKSTRSFSSLTHAFYHIRYKGTGKCLVSV